MYANVLRAGTLSDDRVIRRVSANFVPTHFNNNDPTRGPLDPSDVLWKQILRQKDLQGQGIWVVAPDGTVIAGMSAEVDGHPSEKAGNGPGATWKPNRRYIDAVVEMLDRSLREFGPVTPRTVKSEPLPYRGAGVKPDGSVRLVAYNRADHGLAFSVSLTKDEWQALAPPAATDGARWAIPEAVARNFGPVLSPYADTRFRPRPGDLRSASLVAEVEAVAGPIARIRLTGRWHADWTHDDTEHSVSSATADGIALYDTKAKTMRSLLMVFDGSYNYTSRERPKAKPQPSSAVVRWRLDGPAE
jgi:hypothetical protein